MHSILCIGELLIDFICQDIDNNLVEGKSFLKKAGGAPANVCATISNLGGNCSFTGKVGNDSFGIFLKDTLERFGVGVNTICFDKNKNTTLAFVSLKNNGERDFIFNRGADKYLKFEDINQNSLINSKIIHFGSATAFLGNPLKKTYLELFSYAYNNKKFISFDPNYRDDLWKGNEEEFIKNSIEYIQYSDLIKVSKEEIQLISEKNSIEEGVDFFHKKGAQIVLVTLGSEGTYLSNRKNKKIIKTEKVNSVDSTGAGDAFIGAILYMISKQKKTKELKSNFSQLSNIVKFGNKIGALTCTKIGAMEAIQDIKK